ncbi:very short patch repair endonuclease [Brevundimonas sp. P7753]|uniref:very short patch repair endonuclease n=1 Tax=Brevundimonas TaxID=41275 RepID=UPI0015C00F09|nr:very short patch repair endonuclease [Brevundimonas sp. P7753]MBD3834680.1 DNA mismatch endonuclease Vsr [Brevundimonas sp.]NWE52448.1 DNA mismatch endonuclease Vsr [Brevundimonas sp. P7753]
MTDVFTPEKRSAVMRRVKGRDTAPEWKVRRMLRAAGIGYRLGGCGLPGRPDVVMKGRKVAVFVHGCFWHGHDCPRGARKPQANADYWIAKIDRNRARDARVAAELTAGGWRVLTAWECQLRQSGFAEELVAQVRGQAAALSAASAAAAASSSTWDRAPSSDPGVRGLDTK